MKYELECRIFGFSRRARRIMQIRMNALSLSRRDFLDHIALAAAGSNFPLTAAPASKAEPIIDIHQHTNYGGQRDPKTWQQIKAARSDDQMITHQRNMGDHHHYFVAVGQTGLYGIDPSGPLQRFGEHVHE